MEHNPKYEEMRNFQLDWEKTVTNSTMTWMLTLLGKNFDFIKVVDFCVKNTVHNEMTSHRLGENVCQMHI